MFDTTTMLCPYCDRFSSCGVTSFVKESMRKHIRGSHTQEEIQGYQGKTTVENSAQNAEDARLKEKAQEELKNTFPTIERLVNDPNFCKLVNAEGYQFDLKAILDAFGETCGVKLLKSSKETEPYPDKPQPGIHGYWNHEETSTPVVATCKSCQDASGYIQDMMSEAHAKKYVAKKTNNTIDEYYQAGVYSGLSRALWKLKK